ncbi:MAG TPA: thioredoxin domain-containing protein [Thermoanaerobaculia bacterium]|nr:thioredoxin domain-containing protein [Thermoanaerobaculia bacterium]
MSDHAKGRANRLAGESSPYLLLHQYNPVDWYPWGEEALEKARREDKPIFLSVGYSTCYWCHVMERESFSSPSIAERMNRDFVNIKLDREERPDLDEIYMTATQILNRQGGWPNSVFLTPDLKPFYAGTYFPPESRHGLDGFGVVLGNLANAWKTRRADIEEHAEEMAAAMRHSLEERAEPATEPPGADAGDRALFLLMRRFDREHGGFGGSPKFPTPSNLFLCQEMAGERAEAGEMLAATLDQMARGGIYDQLGGGFHRYATDREWKIPHFEKMLYDNGFLLELYAREHARTGDPQAARIVRETAAWLEREMTSPEGAFWSAIDAETHGHEGAYYVWTREELDAALGEEEATFLAPLLGFDRDPFFEKTAYVLHLPEALADQARRRQIPEEELARELRSAENRLLAARFRRDRPLTDDKILADWNGMVITGLAVAGEELGEPLLVERAATAARFVLERMRPAGGPLLHSWRAGHGKIPAYLSDYVFLVRGLLALHHATGEEGWLRSAIDLTEEQIERLRDPEGGFFVAGASPDVLFRSKDPFDGATPSANAVAALNLLDLAERTGDLMWRGEARYVLQAFAPLVEGYPDGVRMMAIAVRRYHRTTTAAAADEPEAAPVLDPEERVVWERSAEAAGVRKLELEAERLVSVHLDLSGPKEPGASWRPFRLILEIEPGWHIQANPASEAYLVPTAVAAEGAALREVRYPEGDELKPDFAQAPLAVYEGRVEIRGEIGEMGPEACLRITYQLCDDTHCLPEATREVSVS